MSFYWNTSSAGRKPLTVQPSTTVCTYLLYILYDSRYQPLFTDPASTGESFVWKHSVRYEMYSVHVRTVISLWSSEPELHFSLKGVSPFVAPARSRSCTERQPHGISVRVRTGRRNGWTDRGDVLCCLVLVCALRFLVSLLVDFRLDGVNLMGTDSFSTVT